MKSFYCKGCGRMLCKLNFGEIEIKCPNSRCKTVNVIRIISNKHLLQLTAVEENAILKS